MYDRIMNKWENSFYSFTLVVFILAWLARKDFGDVIYPDSISLKRCPHLEVILMIFLLDFD